MENEEWTVAEIVRDSETMPFDEYLKKYYNKEESVKLGIDWNLFWASWISDFVAPAFDPSRRSEFVKNFGLVDESKFDFARMAAFHAEIHEFHLFPEDVERFIGFMAGTGFFKGITLTEWLNSTNWQRKYVVPENGLKKTPLEIINLPNGDNFLRANLTLLDWWRR